MDLDLLTHRITERLTDRLDALDETVRERLPREIAAMSGGAPEAAGRSPSRLLWAALGFAAGMGVAYLADPDRGRSRRTELQQRLSSTSRDVADMAAKRADDTAGQAKGAAMDAARQAAPDDVPDDPKKLEARIKSEVFGRRDDVGQVVLRVDAPGTVAVKGTVPSPVSERELLAEISDVEGVIEVSSELQVAGS